MRHSCNRRQEAVCGHAGNRGNSAFFSVNSRKTIQATAAHMAARKEDEMSARGLFVALFGIGVLLGGCMQSTIEPASEANLTARDKKLLAAAPYEKATIPEPYRRHIVEYHRKEMPGT